MPVLIIVQKMNVDNQWLGTNKFFKFIPALENNLWTAKKPGLLGGVGVCLYEL